MPDSLPAVTARALLPTPESRARMAKAALRKAESQTGPALKRALLLRGWSLKEFSAATHRGERQLARWLDGSEHAQLDTLFDIRSFRQPLIQALSEAAVEDGVDCVTVITIRKAG